MTARWLDTTDAAAWIELDRVRPEERRVGSLVPRRFERFARVFHPLYVQGHGDLVRWAEAARVNGGQMHPLAQPQDVLFPTEAYVPSPRLYRGQSGVGSLIQRDFLELWRALRPHTASTTLLLAFWEGYDVEDFSGPRPLAEVGDLRYVLAELPVEAVHESHQLNPAFSPNLVWPADHSWFWNSDIDEMSTYVGGSADAIADVLNSPGLEAAAVDIDDPLRV